MAKKIAVMTGGEDCPGLNAVIYSLVKSGSILRFEFIQIIKGFERLLGEGHYMPLSLETVEGIAHTGGTLLKSTNEGVFATGESTTV